MLQGIIAQEKLTKLAEEKGMNNPEGLERLIADNLNIAFYSGKLTSARFFTNKILILAPAKAQAIKSADRAALEIPENAF